MRQIKRLGLVLLLALTVTVYANSASATLFIQGVVDPNATVTITPSEAAQNLPIASVPSAPVKVGDITLTSNSGYTVTVASGNSFVLSNQSETVAYTLYYDNVVVDPNSATIDSGSSIYATKELSVFWSTAATVSGTYSDSLTFTITAN